jgi:hypothetical protein
MRGIDVEVTDDGPALFEVVLQDSRGQALELDAFELRDYADELRDLAFGLVHRREVRPLPAGAIRVRVGPDEWGQIPDPDQVAPRVAERILT